MHHTVESVNGLIEDPKAIYVLAAAIAEGAWAEASAAVGAADAAQRPTRRIHIDIRRAAVPEKVGIPVRGVAGEGDRRGRGTGPVDRDIHVRPRETRDRRIPHDQLVRDRIGSGTRSRDQREPEDQGE